jgi:acetylornithine deacetylase/succinyl-diaminopimelate desuccinylase-like protein
VFGSDPNRANLVARIKGSGRKKPILIMGHTDVTIDPKKWIDRGPFSGDVADVTFTAAAQWTTRTT